MFGWVLVGIFAVPALGPLLVDGAQEAATWVWMHRHDRVLEQRHPLVAAERPGRGEVEGFTGTVVDGELVP
ncbi:MAG: hypothetical protein JWO67_7400 [Streptosporangiaceae bacterium]|nr:hypothetical protein [Streptosporangiaceae bacterium]